MAETPTADVQVEHFATREAWLEARQTYGIGSSDVPAILGLSRFQSPLSLYHEKLGLTRPSAAYREHAEWGLILEEPIAQRYARETHRVVQNPNRDGQWSIARRPDRPWMIASVDRFVVGHTGDGGMPLPQPGVGVLEIKNAHLMMRDEWTGDESNHEPPVEYQVQLQHQLAVTGAQWGSIAALIGGVSFLWQDLARDEDLIARLIDLETDFRRRLELRDPPSADGSEATRETLKALYPKDDGRAIALPPDALEWHEALADAKARKKAAAADEDTYSNKLRQAIADASVGLLPDGSSYSLKWQGRKETILPPTEFRVLRHRKGGR